MARLIVPVVGILGTCMTAAVSIVAPSNPLAIFGTAGIALVAIAASVIYTRRIG
jgi:hypothetical protein